MNNQKFTTNRPVVKVIRHNLDKNISFEIPWGVEMDSEEIKQNIINHYQGQKILFCINSLFMTTSVIEETGNLHPDYNGKFRLQLFFKK